MKFRRLFLILFSLFSAIPALHAQYIPDSNDTVLRGKELSDHIYESLTAQGLNARKQQLCRTPENNFPYNILISIPKTQNDESSEKQKYNSIVFIFPQDDIISHLPFVEEFVKWNLESPFNFDVTVLLTACDKSQIAGNDRMTGTEVYADFNQGSETYCAVYTNLNAEKISTITPGSSGYVCPLWLAQLVNTCLSNNRIKPSVIGNFYISLYKQNLLRSTRTLSSFLSRGTPAVEINLKKTDIDKNSLFLIFQDIVKTFNSETDFRDDTHYIPFKFFSGHIWIPENITIILLVILFTLSLIFICDLGFIFRNRHSKKTISTKRALKTLYLVPGTIIVLWICLEIAQFAAYFMYNSFLRNPVAVLGIKLIISFILISFFYLLEIKYHRHQSSYTYEYLLRISSLLNIFIFSAIDISLFYLFAAIYIIITVSLLFKRSLALYFFFILSMLPYFQLVFAIVTYSTPSQVMPLIFANPLINIVLSCAITPLSIILLRIYISLKNIRIKDKDKESSVSTIQKKIKKRFPRYYVLIQFGTIIVLSGFVFLATVYIQNIFKNRINFGTFNGRIIDSPENQFLQVKCTDSSYYGGTIRQLSISTTAPATRLEVFVSGESENPIYYTTYTVTPSEDKNRIQFNLPDFPPENIQLSYTPDNSEVSIIDVYAYYDRDYYPEELINDNSDSRRKLFIKEKASIAISSDKENSRR